MTNTELLDILALSHALIDAGWYRGAFPGQPPPAGKECVLSALAKAWLYSHAGCNPVELSQGVDRSSRFLKTCLPAAAKRQPLYQWNDVPGRRKRDVLRLIERAAAKIGK